jgi:hypothetical protein
MSATSDISKGKKAILDLIKESGKGNLTRKEVEDKADSIATELWRDGRSYDSSWDSD